MLILCEYCDIRCVCYDDWMEHLLSSRHQEIIAETINNWETDLNERSLVISINGAFKPERQDICWYFANYGLVSDAFFETDLEFCVIQLDKKEYADHAMTAKHYMQNATLSLRLKSDVTNAEWLVLNSMVRRKGAKKPASKPQSSFEDRHKKLVETLKFIPIEAQFDRFGSVLTMKTEEVELRQKLVNDMKDIFRKDFPKCFLCPYGSFVTGLGNSQSVLHIYFDAHGHSMQYGRLPENKTSVKKEILENFKKCVEKINRVEFFCCDFIAQPNHSIPYVKFSHHDTGVKCQFTFDSLLPVEASKLLDFILKLDPRLFDLCKFVRYWGEYHKITGPHLISNYSLILLLIVFLTKKRVIPSISVLQSMSSSTMEINGWDASFCTDTNKILNLMSFIGTPAYSTDPKTGKPTAHAILELASDFFKMYAHSDLQSLVICPLIGELLPRALFEAGKEPQLPKTLDTYKNWASVRKPEKRFDSSSLLCIQDPFDLGCNVSKVSPETVVWNFQFLCAETVENMQTILSSSDAKLMEIFKPLSSTTSSSTDQTAFVEVEEKAIASLQSEKSPPPTKEHVVFNYDSNSTVPISVKNDNNHEFGTKTTQSITQQIPGHSENSGHSSSTTEQSYWNQQYSLQQKQQNTSPVPVTSYHPTNATTPVTSYLHDQPQPPVTTYYQPAPPVAQSYHPPQPPMPQAPSYPVKQQSSTYNHLQPPAYHQPPGPPQQQPTYNYQQQYEQRFFSPFPVPVTYPPAGQPCLLPTPSPDLIQPIPYKEKKQSPKSPSLGHRTLTPVTQSSAESVPAKLLVPAPVPFPKPVASTPVAVPPPVVTISDSKWLTNSFITPTKTKTPGNGIKSGDEIKDVVVEAPKIITKPLLPLKSAIKKSSTVIKKEILSPNDSTSSTNEKSLIPTTTTVDSSAQSKTNSKTIKINILSNQQSTSTPAPKPPGCARRISAPTHCLMFGSIEKILRIVPDDAFVRLFKENLGNLVSEVSTTARMNVLWCTFLKEFFAEVWGKSFDFDFAEISPSKIVQSKKKHTKEEDLQYHQMVCNTLPEDEPSAPDPKKPKLEEKGTSSMIVRKLPPIKFAFTPQSNPYKQKFFELNIRYSYEQGYFCYIQNDFYVGRSKLRSVLLQDDALSKEFPNPLEWEGEVTRRDEKKHFTRERNDYKCALVTKIEFDISDKSTVIVMTMKDVRVDVKPSGVMNNLIQHIISVFRSLIPAYQLFRLKKWLGINTQIVLPMGKLNPQP